MYAKSAKPISVSVASVFVSDWLPQRPAHVQFCFSLLIIADRIVSGVRSRRLVLSLFHCACFAASKNVQYSVSWQLGDLIVIYTIYLANAYLQCSIGTCCSNTPQLIRLS